MKRFIGCVAGVGLMVTLSACGEDAPPIGAPDPVATIEQPPSIVPVPAPADRPWRDHDRIGPAPAPTPTTTTTTNCTPTTWYRDADGDGFGDDATTKSACAQPSGWVSVGGDCYDGNAQAFPGSTTFSATDRGDGSFDFDCDGKESIERTDNGGYCLCGGVGPANGCSQSIGWWGDIPMTCGAAGQWNLGGDVDCTPNLVDAFQRCR